METSWTVLDQTDPHTVLRLRRIAVDYEFWRGIHPTDEQQDTQDWTTLLAGLLRSTGVRPGKLTANLDALSTSPACSTTPTSGRPSTRTSSTGSPPPGHTICCPNPGSSGRW